MQEVRACLGVEGERAAGEMHEPEVSDEVLGAGGVAERRAEEEGVGGG